LIAALTPPGLAPEVGIRLPRGTKLGGEVHRFASSLSTGGEALPDAVASGAEQIFYITSAAAGSVSGRSGSGFPQAASRTVSSAICSGRRDPRFRSSSFARFGEARSLRARRPPAARRRKARFKRSRRSGSARRRAALRSAGSRRGALPATPGGDGARGPRVGGRSEGALSGCWKTHRHPARAERSTSPRLRRNRRGGGGGAPRH
jgi:hypothetical protein